VIPGCLRTGKIIKREENKEIDKLSQTGPRYRNVSRAINATEIYDYARVIWKLLVSRVRSPPYQ